MTGSKKVTLTNSGGVNGVDFSGTGSGAEQGIVISDGTNVREVFRTVSAGSLTGFTSTVWTAVSDAPTDTTGGAIGDFIPFLDISEGQALNKVTTQKLLDNALAGLTAKTSAGSTDQVLLFDFDTSVAKVATVPTILGGTFALTAKATPVTADTFPLTDSAASNAAKKVTYGNLATALIGTLAATQANQETATSNVLAVTPGRQHFHPASPKHWVAFTEITTTTNQASYDISSLTDGGAAITTMNFTTAFSTANYAHTVHITNNGDSGWQTAWINVAGDKVASSLKIATANGNFGSNNVLDLPYCNFAFFGDFV
jgi:hypothetical protein